MMDGSTRVGYRTHDPGQSEPGADVHHLSVHPVGSAGPDVTITLP